MAQLDLRLYEEGSERVLKVELDAIRVPVEDRSLLWVDLADGEAALAQLERLDLERATRELVEMSGRSIAFHGDTVRLSVLGLSGATHELVPTRLALLLARNTVVTIHDEPIRGLTDPISVMAHDPRFGRLDAAHFAGLLLEGMLAGYDDVIEDLGREIDELDERALQRESGEGLLEAMVDLRRRIAMLRRALAPQRAIFVALITPVEDDPPPVGLPDASLLAHLERTVDAVERLREQLIGSFDILMARTGQRTNDVMRVLTVVSAVLLPASLLAGIMGMNFQPSFFERPELFFVVLVVMVVIAVGTLAFARRRRWI